MKTIKIPSQNNEDLLSRRELFKLAIPRHQLTPSVIPLSCSGCGLCAIECPTGALTMNQERTTDSLQLLFNYELCDACELCVDPCPEKCLSLKRELSPEKPTGSIIILFRDKVIRCHECNTVIGTKSMIDKLEAKLKSANNRNSRHFQLCPTCKTKALFSGNYTVSIDGKDG